MNELYTHVSYLYVLSRTCLLYQWRVSENEGTQKLVLGVIPERAAPAAGTTLRATGLVTVDSRWRTSFVRNCVTP